MAIPLSGYRYGADHLAQAGGAFDPQKKNMGVLELVLDQLVPGAQEVLTLSLQEFTIPGREVGNGELPYLNGVVNYPTRVSALAPLSVTWRDFPLAKTRAKLMSWFNKVYDEETGLMLPPSLVKITGFCVLFQSDATSERVARIEGIYPAKTPEINIVYAEGEHIVMQMDIRADKVIWEPSLFNPLSAVA